MNQLDRPQILGAVVLGAVVLLFLFNALAPFQIFPDLLWPSKSPEWKEQFQAAVLLVGLPAAFLVWHWRDRNVRDQIENARRDLNLKEFQDIQLRAAGAVEEKYPANARTTLQIAALHQLRPFLRGEQGLSFQRPAYETIRAVLQVNATEAGINRLMDRYDNLRWKFIDRVNRQTNPHNRFMAGQHVRKVLGKGRQRHAQGNLTDLEFALQQIINEEWDHISSNVYKFSPINLSGYRLRNVRLDRLNDRTVRFMFSRFLECDFRNTSLPATRMDGAYFVRCKASNAKLSGCILDAVQIHDSDFSGADLSGCCAMGSFLNSDFSNANFSAATLIGSNCSGNFQGADFREANLRSGRFQGASMEGANLSKADLRGAYLPKILPEHLASCEGAIFDDSTWFFLPTDGDYVSRTNEDILAIHNMWRRLGARHSSDREPSDAGEAGSAA